MWQPDISGRNGPRYRALAEAIIHAIETGDLPVGSRLPPQRELAYALGVTVGTVGRAYQLVVERGLLSAEVGRGSFVRGRSQGEAPPGYDHDRLEAEGVVDFTFNQPPAEVDLTAITSIMADLAADSRLGGVMRYPTDGGFFCHREAGAMWISKVGVDARAGRVLVCGGSQQGVSVALGALARPGDTVLSESLTYCGLNGLATLMRLKLEPLAIDEQGVRVDSVAAAAEKGHAKLLFVNPTIHSPTAATMSRQRRAEIAEIARKHELIIIEDDVHAHLPTDRPPPIAAFAPERTIYISSVTKCLAPGFRIGFILAPDDCYERLVAAQRSLTLEVSGLAAEVVSRCVRTGHDESIIRGNRAAAAARQRQAAEILNGHDFVAHPQGFHLWLRLPPPWRPHDFTVAARARGVAVVPAEIFAIGRVRVPSAVRVSLTTPSDRSAMRRGLTVLAELLSDEGAAGRATRRYV